MVWRGSRRVNCFTDSEGILGYQFRRNPLKIYGFMVFSSCDEKRVFFQKIVYLKSCIYS